LYYLHILVHKKNDSQNEIDQYRIALNRRGINSIEKLSDNL
jgi:hypothetical protein